MEMNLQPRALSCAVTGSAFREGDRVASFLVRKDSGEVVRLDALESSADQARPEGFVACRWVQVFKPPAKEDNPERALKLTAESLFLTLVDPATEANPETERLVRFLALLLERKKVLRPKGLTADGSREVYEHARTKQLHELPVVELSPAFFSAVREQLAVLVGEPRVPSAEPAAPAPAGS